ncbi:MAG: hypothetical protein J0G97_00595 [Rhizobium pusense]|nr:hypothetical protein [Agrobacterium pusense]
MVIHSGKQSRSRKQIVIAMAAMQATTTLCLTGIANAQDAAAGNDATVLETITVTARNIKEEAKDVPFSLSPRQGDALT